MNILPLCLWFLGGSYGGNHDKTPKKRHHYDPDDEFAAPIIHKFKNSPIIRCIDVITVSKSNPRKSSPFPRRFVTTWDVALLRHCLEHIGCLPNNFCGIDSLNWLKVWQRYTTPQLVVTKIKDMMGPVSFTTNPPPTDPFTVITMKSFEFHFRAYPEPTRALHPTALPPLDHVEIDTELEDPYIEDCQLDEADAVDSRSPVDNKPSCAFHILCTLPLKSLSQYCLIHDQIVAEGINAAVANDQQSETNFQNEINFSQPVDLSPIQKLHRIFSQYEVWSIEVEFASIKSACAIPYILTIRDMKSDQIIVSITVDYGSMLLHDLERAIMSHNEIYSIAVQLSVFQTIRYFRK